MTVQIRMARRPGQGKPAVLGELDNALPEGNFQRGAFRFVAHQQVSNTQSRAIQRAAAADTKLPVAISPAVLHGSVHPGTNNLQHTPSF